MEQLTVQATTDQLTGIKNRRSIFEELDRLILNFKEENVHFGVIILDIDFFKNVNDTHGHHAGDLVLVEAAKCFGQNIRSNDFIGRQGGEEFLALIEGADQKEIKEIAERLRKAIESKIMKVDGIELTITISGGIAHSSEEEDRDRLINLADERLYLAKEGGRNKIISDNSN
jgi:diguanylate cyclase (GGDEF)-like protein